MKRKEERILSYYKLVSQKVRQTYYTELANKNICVNSHFYPLGSCTMKYNPCVNEEIASMRSFTDIHPYQVESSVNGNLEIMYLLKKYQILFHS